MIRNSNQHHLSPSCFQHQFLAVKFIWAHHTLPAFQQPQMHSKTTDIVGHSHGPVTRLRYTVICKTTNIFCPIVPPRQEVQEYFVCVKSKVSLLLFYYLLY